MTSATKVPAIPINYPGFKGMVLSRLYIDGQPLDDLQALYTLNTKALGGTKWNDPNRFWATPPRPAHSKQRDVLEVDLAAPQRINRFTFQAANFPSRIWLQYWNTKHREWRPVRHKKHGNPVRITISKSVPRHIHSGVFDRSHRHPQHRGAGHWETYSIHCKTIRAARVRLVLAHLPGKNAPVDQRNQPVDYSLAIQDFQFGYRVNQWSDIPRDLLTAPTQSEADFTAFSTSTDLLGSPVEFGMRLYRPSDLLWPLLEAQAGVPADSRTHDADVWKCEPQPFSFCVVNLYVDARDDSGNPQSVDRFYVEPTTNGVAANLYYSNDTPDYASIAASDDEIRYPGLAAGGDVTPTSDGLMLPNPALMSDPTAAVGYLDLRRQVLQWDFTQPWWVGLTFTPQFDSTDTTAYTILDSPGLAIAWDGPNASGPTFKVRVQDTWLYPDYGDFASGTEVRMLVTFDQGQGTVHYGLDTRAAAVNVLSPSDMLTQVGGDKTLNGLIRFGGARVAGFPGNANVLLENLVIKREQYLDTVSYLANPDPYLLHPEDDDEDGTPDYTDNAILRVHPSFQSPPTGVNPYGFIGSPGDIYANLIWSPINRDFQLHKGFLQFDPVRACYFKFEFTNLVPRPYATYTPVRRRVKMFSSKTRQLHRQWRATRGGTTNQTITGSGADTNLALSLTPQFSDQARLGPASLPYPDYGPTEALFAADPTTRDRLTDMNPLYGQMPVHQPASAPRFTEAQRHVYEVVEIEHKDKIAFFVGLKELRMFKVDYAAADDTPAYLWLFHDDSNIQVTLPDEPGPTPPPSGPLTMDIPATVTGYGIREAFVGSPVTSIQVNDGDTSYMRSYATVVSGSSAGSNVDINFPATPIPGDVISTSLVMVTHGTDTSNVPYLSPPPPTGNGWILLLTTGPPSYDSRYWPNPTSPAPIFPNGATGWTETVTPLQWDSGSGLVEYVTKTMLEAGTVQYNPGYALLNNTIGLGASGSYDGYFTYIALRVVYNPTGP